MNGFIRRVMQIRSFRVNLPSIVRRYSAKVIRFITRHNIDVAKLFCFFDGFVRPHACIDIISRGFATQYIHWNHRKLLRRATLQKQHFVVAGNVQ